MLSARYHTYAVDLRNHGQSPHDETFDYPSMVDDVAAFLDAHGIENPVLMGHSMGGKVAMNFAVAHPDKLGRLIVVDIAGARLAAFPLRDRIVANAHMARSTTRE